MRETILAAAGVVLARDGFRALTMDAVAAEARASKATIYRHWPDKAALAMDALVGESDPAAVVPDTGSLEDDLRRQVRALTRAFARGHVREMLLGVLTALPVDPRLQRVFRERFAEPRRRAVAAALRRAVERGELTAPVDADTFSDALYGALYLRLLMGTSLTRADADRAVGQALHGTDYRSATATPAAASSPR